MESQLGISIFDSHSDKLGIADAKLTSNNISLKAYDTRWVANNSWKQKINYDPKNLLI